ncbi:MAG TPA: hypothetical protein VN203_05725 [Candidatus Acidoferrum sp.]|nr:hypothetical protein [Candidatus Acidoferrum sp.]
MKITIIVLCRDDTAERYAGAVKGELTQEQKSDLIDRMNLALEKEQGSSDRLYFCAVELCEHPDQLNDLRAVEDDEQITTF